MPTSDSSELGNNRPQETHNDPKDSIEPNKRKKSLNLTKWITVAAIAIVATGTTTWFLIDNANSRDVPTLVGKTFAEAEALVASTGPKLSADQALLVEQVPGELVEIIGQDPEQGSRIHFEDSIKVSVVPLEVDVPDLRGQTFSLAEKTLAASGLPIERVNSVPAELGEDIRNTISMWEVTDQSIEPGRTVVAGTGVVLSLNIPKVKVPELTFGVGPASSLESAQSSFETSASDEMSRELLVAKFRGQGYAPLSSSPSPGERVPAFTEVNVTLGIPMPDMVTKEIKASEAVEELKAMGFTSVSSSHEDETVVVGQNVKPGSVVAVDADIELENKPKGYAYRVTGNGSVADVSWSQPGSHNTQQANDTPLPWEKVFDPAMSGSTMLSGYLTDGGTEITCQVLRDGVIVKEFSSSGANAMVSCN